MFLFFFFQAEDGIRDLVRSRGLGDVYKRQIMRFSCLALGGAGGAKARGAQARPRSPAPQLPRLSLIHI